MSDTIYFQWQNPFLLKTIYPLREMKLRDFLVHYSEIDLWKRDKDLETRDPAEYQRRMAIYIEDHKKAIVDMVETFGRQKAYFVKTEQEKEIEKGKETIRSVHEANLTAIEKRATEKAKSQKAAKDNVLDNGVVKQVEPPISCLVKYKEDFETVAKKIEAMHNDFNKYLNNYYDTKRKEKVFLIGRMLYWEQYLKEITKEVAKKRVRVAIVTQDRKEEEARELEKLETVVLPMVEEEYKRLKAFADSYNKLEKRYQILEGKKKTLLAEKEGKMREIANQRRKMRPVEYQCRKLEDEITRIKNPPLLELLEKHFSFQHASDHIRQIFENKNKDQKLFTRFDDLKKAMSLIVNKNMGADVKGVYVRTEIRKMDEFRATLESELANLEDTLGVLDVNSSAYEAKKNQFNNLRDFKLKAVVEELNELGDLEFGIRYGALSESARNDLIAKTLPVQEQELGDAKAVLLKGRSKTDSLKNELERINADLRIPDEERLVTYDPGKKITINDLVIYDIEKFRKSLESLDHETLLEMVVERFVKDPRRYPLWLQYMVIHFSGMRYASAHGSWADPRQLLLNLRTEDLQKEFQNKSDDDVAAERMAKLKYYETTTSSVIEDALDAPPPPAFASSKDNDEDDGKDKIKDYVKQLNSIYPYEQRKGLLNLRLDEEKFEIEKMSDAEVADDIETYRFRKNDPIPDWMWNEIIELVPELRMRHVTTTAWENLSAKDAAEKSKAGKYRQIMNDWSMKNLTNWREEHDEGGQLVVSRAVCNEVAEHIQHMRGHKGAAGLTEKPNWYSRVIGEYKNNYPNWKGEKPYFKKPTNIKDFKEGASLLWLKFVHKKPNEWQIAEPITVNDEPLVPAWYTEKKGGSYDWRYTVGGDITRTRLSKDGKGRESQFLRWLHEATIAEVAEDTAEEGPFVLTFETNLPHEDRRLSTIGVFKRYPHHLVSDLGEEMFNPSYVGFVPEGDMEDKELNGEIPVDQFKEMLNWNKILRREYMSPQKLEAFQTEYIKRRSLLPKDLKSKDHPAVIEMINDLAERKRNAVSILANPDYKLYRARNWGDPLLVKQAGLSALVAKTSNFNPLPLFSDGGTWSAIVNALVIPRKDINKLADLQVEDAMKVKNKMNWLVYEGEALRPYWSKGTGSWENAPQIWWGTILFGGQLVLTDGDETFFTQLPEEPEEREVHMKRLVCFRQRDWGVTHDTHPWLIQLATEVSDKDRFNSTPKGGRIYSPLWSPKDWEFYNGKRVDAFYVPAEWLIECPHYEQYRILSAKEKTQGPPISTVQ